MTVVEAAIALPLEDQLLQFCSLYSRYMCIYMCSRPLFLEYEEEL